MLRTAVGFFTTHQFANFPKSKQFCYNFASVNLRFFKLLEIKQFCKMVDAKLDAVPLVDIEEGIFKYVLINVYAKEKNDGTEPTKKIVRGYADCEWHSDIYERVSTSCQGLGLETECLGGGRIEHNPSAKLIKVYGYSQGYGKADHSETKNILRTKYTDYDIEISDEENTAPQTTEK